jgi:hypothetical protein
MPLKVPWAALHDSPPCSLPLKTDTWISYYHSYFIDEKFEIQGNGISLFSKFEEFMTELIYESWYIKQ